MSSFRFSILIFLFSTAGLIICLFFLIFFIVIRTQHESYPLNFLTVQFSVVSYRYNVGQQISKTYSCCLTETLCLLVSDSSFFPSSKPLTIIIPLFYQLDNFRYLLQVKFMQYFSFCNWFISLGIIASRFICFISYCKISFFLKSE